MKTKITLLVLALTTFFACEQQPKETADTIYTNGKIYTVNETQPWVEALAIKDGKFIKVGTSADIEVFKGENTTVVNLKGQFVMPGIIDPHIHPALLMTKRAYCSLPGTFFEPSEEDILTALKEAISNYPENKEWFIGQGFSSAAMSKETLSRKVLDELIPNKPAWIEDESGHNAWFNTKAMELAGITKDFEDTPESFFSRTPTGDIAGVAYEGAMNPFLEILPAVTTKDRKDAFSILLNEALSKGITAFGDGYVFRPDLQAYEELNVEGKLKQHAALYLKGNLGTDELTPVDTLLQWWNTYKLPGHKAVKLGMGGAIESGSEALVDGYADSKIQARPIIDAEKFADYIAQLDEAGFQVKVHAIGDGSVRATIDGYESVINANGNNRLRHHIDHASLVHADDFDRLVDLDISISIWPPLNAPLDYNLKGIKPMLKPETWERMYANRERWDAGIRLVNHSDAPAAVLWPWWGMEASISRGFPGKPEKGKMGPQHALKLEEVIISYTVNAAWSLLIDDLTGSIEEGKYADFIILNHNLFEIPTSDIHKTEIQSTYFKGKEVYAAK